MNIILTGMPASGKTTAADALVHLLQGYELIDTDKEIIKTEEMSINDIFALKGECYFRELEGRVLKEILKKDMQIISSGGGIIKSIENRRLIKETAVCVYLKADIETLLRRALKSAERPLLKSAEAAEIRKKLETLLKEREEKYKDCAHIIIDIADKTPEEEAEEMQTKINEYIKCKN